MVALDTRIFLFFYAAGREPLLTLALILSAIGNGWIMLGLVPLWARPQWRRLAVHLAAVVASTTAIVFALKLVVERPRPCVALAGVHPLCAMPADPSFPSGHACGAFAVVTFLVVALRAGKAVRGRRLTRTAMSVALVSLAIGIAWSRVYLGVHFPGDVAAGALLGMLSGAIGARIFVRVPQPHRR